MLSGCLPVRRAGSRSAGLEVRRCPGPTAVNGGPAAPSFAGLSAALIGGAVRLRQLRERIVMRTQDRRRLNAHRWPCFASSIERPRRPV